MKPDMDNQAWVGSKLSLPPATVRVVAWEPGRAERVQLDALIEAEWEGQRARFAAEIKRRSTPRVIQEAIAMAIRAASPPDEYPMVVVPYLSREKLLQLEAEGISGIDLCGNGVLVVPGRMLVFRSGNSNQFRESPKLKNAYRGMISLVARAFLIQPRFCKAKEIELLLESRGESVVPSTISKALKRLDEDLVISREGRRVRLIQAEMLLDKLAANYEPPQVESQFQGKCSLPLAEMARRLARAASKADGKVVRTGAASMERYAVSAGEPMLSVYTTMAPAELLEESDVDAQETSRFANLEIIQTNDARVFSDAREGDGVPYASPVQTYLELSAGDKRQKDAAEQVRQGILDSLESSSEDESP